MEYSTISVRIDKENKKAFDKFCHDVGMNTSTAISLFIFLHILSSSYSIF